MPGRGRVVAVVDDDESVRESLPDLLRSYNYDVDAFSCAEAFLDSPSLATADCLVLDVAMPGMSGPQLQRELAVRRPGLPIVFITARPEEAARARVMEHGAAAVLVKPFSEADLIAAVGVCFGPAPQ